MTSPGPVEAMPRLVRGACVLLWVMCGLGVAFALPMVAATGFLSGLAHLMGLLLLALAGMYAAVAVLIARRHRATAVVAGVALALGLLPVFLLTIDYLEEPAFALVGVALAALLLGPFVVPFTAPGKAWLSPRAPPATGTS